MAGRGDTEDAFVSVETSVHHEDVALGIESQEIAEGLHGDDGAGDGIIFGKRLLEEYFQGLPRATAEVGKDFSIVRGRPR